MCAAACSAAAVATLGVVVAAGPAQAQQPRTCISVDNRLGHDITVSFDYPAIAPMTVGAGARVTPTDGPGGAPLLSPSGSWTIVAPGQKEWIWDPHYRAMPGCNGLWTVRLHP
ncbi:hypothetical protein JK358_06760 [Nocardia sp. 2]|uniref:Uncharacterized protein n=1 Tax=Nocardia acididurans TaxID=2802282 RepID=A0ABS1M0A0_9NOCA|nr:hypothetical protein [Nocardia acididurans]MBL1074092.1 hypothetical protein [Nocardia acididurans]